ncbi:hypothetical protein [Prosthecobacter dejongeii]|uniref:Uncharacterized protein n=1 Tax=Prosthecobacter dejongeii TaxID=48465 RepID=A0A7W7YHK7_9BACT|nr:hypothetical protein [Prosthecobacter dejongeii]MBB5036356.1 hypothetical protein [Prosthecobacter dejongeii]
MKHPFSPSGKIPPELLHILAGLVKSSDSIHSPLVTATAAKIEVKSRQADMAPVIAVVAGAMRGAVPAVTGTMTRVIAVTATTPVVGSVSRVVMAGVASIVVGAMTASMTGTAGMMAVSRLHCGRSEDGEAGSDRQQSDDLSHNALVLDLSRYRQRAACKSDGLPSRLFI